MPEPEDEERHPGDRGDVAQRLQGGIEQPRARVRVAGERAEHGGRTRTPSRKPATTRRSVAVMWPHELARDGQARARASQTADGGGSSWASIQPCAGGRLPEDGERQAAGPGRDERSRWPSPPSPPLPPPGEGRPGTARRRHQDEVRARDHWTPASWAAKRGSSRASVDRLHIDVRLDRCPAAWSAWPAARIASRATSPIRGLERSVRSRAAWPRPRSAASLPWPGSPSARPGSPAPSAGRARRPRARGATRSGYSRAKASRTLSTP